MAGIGIPAFAWAQAPPRTEADGPPVVEIDGLYSFPMDDLPREFLALPQGTFAVASASGVYELTQSGQVVSRWAGAPASGTDCSWSAVEQRWLVGACSRSFVVEIGERYEPRVDLSTVVCSDGQCVQTMNGANLDPSDYRSLAATMSSAGPLHAVLHRRQTNDAHEEISPERVEVLFGTTIVQAVEVRRDDPEYDLSGGDRQRLIRLGNMGRVDARVHENASGYRGVAIRVGSELNVYVGRVRLGPFRSSYDWHYVVDPSGTSHLVYFEPNSRELHYVRIAMGATITPLPLVIDSAEAGFESDVSIESDGLHLWYYFYRNPFYKGVRHVTLPWGSAAPSRPDDIIHSEVDNFGWGIAASPPLNGYRLACYGVGRAARFSLASGASPEVPSGQCSVLSAYAQPPIVETRFPNYRPFFFMVGGGVWARPWNMWSIRPSEEDLDGAEPYDLTYRIGSAIQLETVLEGRIGRTRLGLTYARSVAEDVEDLIIDEALGDVPPILTQQLRGLVSFDRLIANHDLQLQFNLSRMNTQIRSESDPTSLLLNQQIESSANEVRISALNIYRMRYGLRYQNFSTSVPIYEYVAGAGQQEYSFARAYVLPTRMHDIGALFGYSLLDYAVKYETRLGRPYVDIALGAGVAIAQPDLARAEELFGTELSEDDFRTPVSLSLFGELEAGYLAYRRFAGAGQAGLFAKVGLRVWAEYRGSAGKPGDRKADADDLEEPSVVQAFNLTDIRYGPFLQVGMVF